MSTPAPGQQHWKQQSLPSPDFAWSQFWKLKVLNVKWKNSIPPHCVKSNDATSLLSSRSYLCSLKSTTSTPPHVKQWGGKEVRGQLEKRQKLPRVNPVHSILPILSPIPTSRSLLPKSVWNFKKPCICNFIIRKRGYRFLKNTHLSNSV